MRCRKIARLLDSFLDGELPEEKRQEVIDHLEGCPVCRQRLEALQNVETLSRQLTQAEPDEAYWRTFLPRLQDKITQTEKAPARRRIREAFGDLLTPPIPWVRIAGAVATAVLVFFVGRAVIHHEARMRRIRALPKKLLTEQVRTAEDRVEPRKDVTEEQEESPLIPRIEPRGLKGQENLEMGRALSPQESPKEKRIQEEAPSKPSSKPDQELPLVSKAVPSKTQTQREAVTPSPHLEPTESADQVVPSELLALEGERREFSFLGTAAEKTTAVTSWAMVDKGSDADHWRRQIEIWQDFITTHPRSDQLGQAHLHLAANWYHLALNTTQHEDVLNAMEVHRAALDFATEKTTRSLLRSRIETLEKMLEKK